VASAMVATLTLDVDNAGESDADVDDGGYDSDGSASDDQQSEFEPLTDQSNLLDGLFDDDADDFALELLA
jgi:hypothetical protein